MFHWLTERLIFSGDQYYKEVFQAIDDAQTSVDLETYIYDDDEIGRGLEQRLIAARARGVRVRMTVDGFGAAKWAERRASQIAACGIDVRLYHPVHWSGLLWKLVRWFRNRILHFRPRAASRGRSLLGHLNRRLHRKLVIIDGVKVWVGSLNVSGVHSERCSGNLSWRDTAVFLEAEPGDKTVPLATIAQAFELAHNRAHRVVGPGRWRRGRNSKRLELADSELFRLNFTIRLRRRHYYALLRLIRSAKEKIWITNAYLAPSKPLLGALERAASRGVDVRVLVPRQSDVFFMPWVAQAHYVLMLEAGVQLFEYQPRFLHAKSVVIDRWAAVGSSNLNRRSILRDLEVDVVLTRPESRLQLESQYAKDLEHAIEIKVAPRGFQAFAGRLISSFLKELI